MLHEQHPWPSDSLDAQPGWPLRGRKLCTAAGLEFGEALSQQLQAFATKCKVCNDHKAKDLAALKASLCCALSLKVLPVVGAAP